jgi:hypothetical protein
MKNLILLFISFLTFSAFAQSSNLTIFSENDEQFQVSVNGAMQNQQPSTHVKIPGLNPATYRIRVKFSDASLGQVSRNMLIEPGQEYSVVVKKKKNTAVGGYFKEVGKAVDESLGTAGSAEEDPSEVYVMRLISATPIPQNSSQGNNQNGSVGFPSGGSSNSYQQQNNSQQNNSNSNGSSGSGSFNLNINASENGLNMNMDVKDPESTGNSSINMNTNTQSSQSSQSSSWSSWDNSTSGSGAVTNPTPSGARCASAMSSGTFEKAKTSIDNQGFDETKLKIAKQAIAANCMSVAQIGEVMEMFGFEKTKLDFAKYAYDFTSDPQNYFELNDRFGFSSTVEELDSYLESKR